MDTCIICSFGTKYQIIGNINWFSEFLNKSALSLIVNESECILSVNNLPTINALIFKKLKFELKSTKVSNEGHLLSFEGEEYLINLRENNNFYKAWLTDLYHLTSESLSNGKSVYFLILIYLRSTSQ